MTIRSALRVVVATLAVLPFALSSQPAAAKKPKAGAQAAAPAPAKKKSIALGSIAGKRDPALRGWVREALQDDFEITDAEGFKVKGDDNSYLKMAADLGVEAVMVGKLEKNRLVLTVRDAADGKPLGNIELKAAPGPKLKSLIKKRLKNRVYAAFGLSSPQEQARKQARAKQEAEEDAAEDEGADAEEESSEAASKDDGKEEKGKQEADSEKESPSTEEAAGERVPRGPFGSPLVLRGGLKFTKRNFSFHDTLAERVPGRVPAYPLIDYQGGLDLSLVLRGELYPLAFTGSSGFGSNLGIVGGFEYGIPSTTVYKAADGSTQDLKNHAQEWYLGARVRVPFSAGSGLGVTGSYHQQKYLIKGDETAPRVPDVAYNLIRLGADVRGVFGKVWVEGALGARLILSTGELENQQSWFKNVGGKGLDAALTLGYDVTPVIAVIAGGEFIRYGFNFNPVPDNAIRVAGGAVDQYISGILGVSIRLPGSADVSADH